MIAIAPLGARFAGGGFGFTFRRHRVLGDDLARAGRVGRAPGLLGGTLDHHAADAGLGEAGHEILAQAQVLMKHLAVFLAGEPAAVPGPIDAEPKPDRIDLLTHYACSSSR